MRRRFQPKLSRGYRWLQHYSPWVARWFSRAHEQIAKDAISVSLVADPQTLQDYNKNIAALLQAQKYSWAEDIAAEALRRFGRGRTTEHYELYRLRIVIAEQHKAWTVVIRRLTALIKMQPSEARAGSYRWLAHCYFQRKNNFAKAEAAAQSGINSVSIPNGGPFPLEYIRLCGLYADIAIRREDWSAAIARLQTLLGVQSEKARPTTYIKLSDCYVAKGDFGQAMDAFKQAMLSGKGASEGGRIGLHDPRHAFFYDPKNPLRHVPGHRCNIGFYPAVVYINEYLKKIGCTLIVVRHPILREMKNLSRWEKRLKNGYAPSYTDFHKFHHHLGGDTKDYYKDIKLPNKVIVDGLGLHIDHCGHYTNFLRGRRQVVDQPTSFQRTVWCVGSSRYGGIFCQDKHTIPSFLQQRFNDSEQKIRVVDCSVGGNTVRNQIETIKRISLQQGDIVVLEDRFYVRSKISRNYENSVYALHGIAHCDLNDDFRERRYAGEMFYDNRDHVTYRGNQEIARILHERFFSALPLIDSPLAAEINRLHRITHGSDNEGHARDQDLITRIRAAYAAVPVFATGKVGAIVMNCNPITLGHLHLIRLAAQIVDHLYVFVVEEDRSVFPFADRLAMIGQAVAPLANVVVVPSGRFILSAETFPEYFEKDMKQDTTIDTSHDIGLFGGCVARHFNITIRFVGEEPTDTVTRQYNEEMKAALPRHGVQVIEIPRLTCDDDVISASRVRALLRDGRWDDLARLCPPTTVAYLRQMAQDGRLPLLG